MRFGRIAAALAVTAVVGTGLAQGTASAMTTISAADGDMHPAVVAMVIVSPTGDAASMYCSGTLIAPTVVLTASHCNAISTEQWFIDGHYRLGVTNVPSLNVDSSGYLFAWTGTGRQAEVVDVRSNALYKSGYRDDVSAQVIAHALDGVAEVQMPKIPPVGLLDRMQMDKTLKSTVVTVFGYGTAQKTIPANTGPTFPDTNERRYADLATIALDKQWIHQDQNLGKNPDQGGACYGDSGGPSLMQLGKVTYVVGVTSTGDGPCFATNVASRVDNASAHALIGSVDPKLLPTP